MFVEKLNESVAQSVRTYPFIFIDTFSHIQPLLDCKPLSTSSTLALGSVCPGRCCAANPNAPSRIRFSRAFLSICSELESSSSLQSVNQPSPRSFEVGCYGTVLLCIDIGSRSPGVRIIRPQRFDHPIFIICRDRWDDY